MPSPKKSPKLGSQEFKLPSHAPLLKSDAEELSLAPQPHPWLEGRQACMRMQPACCLSPAMALATKHYCTWYSQHGHLKVPVQSSGPTAATGQPNVCSAYHLLPPSLDHECLGSDKEAPLSTANSRPQVPGFLKVKDKGGGEPMPRSTRRSLPAQIPFEPVWTHWGSFFVHLWPALEQGAYCALCTRCARAVRKVGCSPPPGVR